MAALAASLDANATAQRERSRTGECVSLCVQAVPIRGIQPPMYRVPRLSQRAIDKHRRVLIVPELTPESWMTRLPAGLDAKNITVPYADNGAREQFHSEFKTDLDLTRLPWGKFDTNSLACQMQALPMNTLRLMRECGLLGPDAHAVRHGTERRRIKTVMQALSYSAGRLIEHGQRLILGLGTNGCGAKAFARVRGELVAVCT